jgi:predicted RNA-binding Zn ribbon-like protein
VDFTHYTDRSVDLAVDLVNTYSVLTGTDQLDQATLGGWLTEFGFEVGEEDVIEARQIRQELRGVFEAPDEESAVEVLNHLLANLHAVARVSLHGKHGPHLHFEPPDASPARWLGATAAMGLAMVICDHGLARLGICNATTCGDVYVDSSRNRSRLYCSETCSTREAVAAHRRRRVN